MSKWSIEQIKILPSYEGKTDVVYQIFWRATLDPVSIARVETITAKMDQFIPFEDLTEDIALGWVKTAMGQEAVDLVESDLVELLRKLKETPKAIVAPLPWV